MRQRSGSMSRRVPGETLLRFHAFVALTGILGGCATRTTAWKAEVEWPDETSAQLVAPSVEAGAALAAAAALREMMGRNPYPDLFSGCSSPEQGLNVAVFKYPKTGLYYVMVHQRFDRCGGPRVRVLDGLYAYAVTPQGEVVAEGPPRKGETPAAFTGNPSPSTPEQAPAPVAQPPAEGEGIPVGPASSSSVTPPQPAAASPATSAGTPTPSPPGVPSTAPVVPPLDAPSAPAQH
jgi:hypothetical protein